MLSVSDLLAPAGEIDGPLFYPALTGSEVNARLGVFLAQGYAITPHDTLDADALARYYSYFRAWNDVVNRITLKPASSSLAGEVSTSMLQTQINTWIEARDRWQGLYLGLITDTSTATTPGVSQPIPTTVRF